MGYTRFHRNALATLAVIGVFAALQCSPVSAVFSFTTEQNTTTLSTGGGHTKGGGASFPTSCVDQTDSSYVYTRVSTAGEGVYVQTRNATHVLTSTIVAEAPATWAVHGNGILCTATHIMTVDQADIRLFVINSPGNITYSGLYTPPLQFDSNPVTGIATATTFLFYASESTIAPHSVYEIDPSSGTPAIIARHDNVLIRGGTMCASSDGRFVAGITSDYKVEVFASTYNDGTYGPHKSKSVLAYNNTLVGSGTTFFPTGCVIRDSGNAWPDIYLFGADTDTTSTPRSVRIAMGGHASELTVASTTLGPKLSDVAVAVGSYGDTRRCILAPSNQVVYCTADILGGIATVIAYVADDQGDFTTAYKPVLSADATTGFGMALDADGSRLFLSNVDVAWNLATNDKVSYITNPLVDTVAIAIGSAVRVDSVLETAIRVTVPRASKYDDLTMRVSCIEEDCVYSTVDLTYYNVSTPGNVTVVARLDDVADSPDVGAVALTRADNGSVLTTGAVETGLHLLRPRAPRVDVPGNDVLASPRVVMVGTDAVANLTGVLLSDSAMAQNVSASVTTPITQLITIPGARHLLYGLSAAGQVEIFSRALNGTLTHLATQTIASLVSIRSDPTSDVIVGLLSTAFVTVYTVPDTATGLLVAASTIELLAGVTSTVLSNAFIGIFPSAGHHYALVYAVNAGDEYLFTVSYAHATGIISTSNPRLMATEVGPIFTASTGITAPSNAVTAVVPVASGATHGGSKGLSCIQVDGTLTMCGLLSANASTSAPIFATHTATTGTSLGHWTPVRTTGALGIVCSDRRRQCASLTATGFESFHVDVETDTVHWLQSVDTHAACTHAAWHDGSLLVACNNTVHRYNEGSESGWLEESNSHTFARDVSALMYATVAADGRTDDHIYTATNNGTTTIVTHFSHDHTSDPVTGVAGLVTGAILQGILPTVTFTLPEDALINTLVLEWNVTGHSPQTLSLSAESLAAGVHTFTNVSLYWTTAGQATRYAISDERLRNGTVSITIGYRDLHGNVLGRAATIANVTVISSCTNTDMDPTTGCTACSWRFAGSCSTNPTCIAGRFDDDCRRDTDQCRADRCSGQGACATQLQMPYNSANSTATTAQCTCDTGFFGHSCQVSTATCTNDRCGGFGVCAGQYHGHGCTCADGYDTFNATSGDAFCTKCVGDLINHLYVYNSTHRSAGGCIACKPYMYGAGCTEVEPVCATAVADGRFTCEYLVHTATGRDLIVDGTHMVTATDVPGCECFRAYGLDEDGVFTNKDACGPDGAFAAGSFSTCKCAENQIASSDPAHSAMQCIRKCQHDSVYVVESDTCDCVSGWTGAQCNHQTKKEGAAFGIMFSIIGLAIAIIGGILYVRRSGSAYKSVAELGTVRADY